MERSVPEREGDLAGFDALAQDRLVASLVAETGLPVERATAIVGEVAAAAAARGLTADNGPMLYGWMRVAARRRALDERNGTSGSDAASAADAALLRLSGAQRAMSVLPEEQREVLRLRYVDGLLPEAIAERLGLPVATVLTRLDAARGVVARELRRHDRPAPSLVLAEWRRRAAGAVRPAAAAALTALAVVLTLPDSPTADADTPPRAPLAAPPAAGDALATVDVADSGNAVRVPDAHDAATTVARPTARVLAVAKRAPAPGTHDAPIRRTPPRKGPKGPTLCESTGVICLTPDGSPRGDKVRVPLPGGNPAGAHELVVAQDAVPVCTTVGPPETDVAKCDRGDS